MISMERRKRAGIGLICFVMTLIAVLTPGASDSAEQSQYNRYNAVLVMDASGSLDHVYDRYGNLVQQGTDPDKLRFEAAIKFVGLLSNSGNKLGGVVFTGHASSLDLKDVRGNLDKTEILDAIQGTTEKNSMSTNIGLGLETAVNMLIKDADKNNPSIILLFTDGNRHLPDGWATDEVTGEVIKLIELSERREKRAIELAKQNNIKIHVICLNTNPKKPIDTDEIKKLSESTGGWFENVKELKELVGVYEKYYREIYNAIVIPGKDYQFSGENGTAKAEFMVPSFGIEEINIIMDGAGNDPWLSHENSAEKIIPTPENIFKYDQFTILKIQEPTPGKWAFYVNGVPEDKIKIDFVYNSKIGTKLSLKPAKEKYGPGEKIDVTFSLLNEGTPVSADQYRGFSARLYGLDHENEDESVEMNVKGNSFAYELKPSKLGTFNIYATISNEISDLKTESVTIQVENTAPKAKDVEKSFFLMSRKEKEFNLSGAVKDQEDKSLLYEIDEVKPENSNLSIDGDRLTLPMDDFKVGLFAFRSVCAAKITATDSEGESATFKVRLIAYDGWKVLGCAGVFILLVLGLIFLIRRILRGRTPFHGTITLCKIENGHVKTAGGGKVVCNSDLLGFGKCLIRSISAELAADALFNAYFLPTSGEKIIFGSGKRFFTNVTLETETMKKYELEDGDQINVYADAKRQTGIQIKYKYDYVQQ